VHDAVAGAICIPHVTVQIDGRARRISWLSIRRSEIFAKYLPCLRIDLDDRALRRHGDPQEVEFMGCGIEVQLVRDVVNDVEQATFVEMGVERVGPFGERLRLDYDRQFIACAEFAVGSRQSQDVRARRRENRDCI
jgi:hypothetical protein